jgi:hypothetical protein
LWQIFPPTLTLLARGALVEPAGAERDLAIMTRRLLEAGGVLRVPLYARLLQDLDGADALRSRLAALRPAYWNRSVRPQVAEDQTPDSGFSAARSEIQVQWKPGQVVITGPGGWDGREVFLLDPDAARPMTTLSLANRTGRAVAVAAAGNSAEACWHPDLRPDDDLAMGLIEVLLGSEVALTAQGNEPVQPISILRGRAAAVRVRVRRVATRWRVNVEGLPPGRRYRLALMWGREAGAPTLLTVLTSPDGQVNITVDQPPGQVGDPTKLTLQEAPA